MAKRRSAHNLRTYGGMVRLCRFHSFPICPAKWKQLTIFIGHHERGLPVSVTAHLSGWHGPQVLSGRRLYGAVVTSAQGTNEPQRRGSAQVKRTELHIMAERARLDWTLHTRANLIQPSISQLDVF